MIKSADSIPKPNATRCGVMLRSKGRCSIKGQSRNRGLAISLSRRHLAAVPEDYPACAAPVDPSLLALIRIARPYLRLLRGYIAII